MLEQLAVEGRGCAVGQLELGLRQLARLQAALDACHARLLAEFDAARAWQPSGAVDQISWLRQHAHLSAQQAAEKVKIAAVVAAVPEAALALSDGTVGSGHVRVLANADRELVSEHGAELVGLARQLPVEAFQREVQARAQRMAPDDAAARMERQYRARGATSFVDDEGLTRVTAWLDPVSGAVFTGAWDQLTDELYARDPALSPRARRADALVEMARRAVAVVDDARLPAPSLIVLIDHERLLERLEGAGIDTRLDDGHPIPAATARRLACEAGILPAVLGGDSRTLDLGRSRRLVSPAQRQALIVRDGGCVFPGCDRPWRWCQAHHLQPWEQGGRTDLGNLALLCVRHHHHVHEGGWSLEHLAGGAWEARSPSGEVVPRRARAPTLARAG